MNSKETTTVRVTHTFNFSPERVFDAWLDPEKARKWLFATPTGEIVRVEIDARPGGRFCIVDRRDGEDIEHVGEYMEIDRPRRLSFRFTVPKYTNEFTCLTIDIVPKGDGCEVTLTHEDVWTDFASKTESGWEMILDSLERALEA